MIKIFHFPFSSGLESRSAENLPRQILSLNSNRKSSYFKRKVQLQLAAITRFKNGREPHRELDLVGSRGPWHHIRNTTMAASLCEEDDLA